MPTIVLFICTGNIFRSYAAEKLFNDRTPDGYKAISAGIRPDKDDPRSVVIDRLKEHGVTPETGDAAEPLTREHIARADYAIAMSSEHQEYVYDEYDVSIPLFNNVVGDDGSIPDVDEVDADRTDHVTHVVDHIAERITDVYDNREQAVVDLPSSYTQFIDLLNGGDHEDGTAYQEIVSNDNAVAFHSIDIPNGEQDHVLVIPRERYVYYHNIPGDIVADMTRLAQRVGQALMDRNDGYNLLLNNGHSAGQEIYHAHIHIVGRHANDNIRMEGWRHQRISSSAYKERSEAIRDTLHPDNF